jgi:metal-responsive CopG/Arc/MetJ family transcriptional regulator
MAKVTISLTLDDERDKRILRWIKSQPKKGKSEAIRKAIRVYLDQSGVTLQDIYDEIQDLKRYRVALVSMEQQGQPLSDEDKRVSSRAFDNLSKIGKD